MQAPVKLTYLRKKKTMPAANTATGKNTEHLSRTEWDVSDLAEQQGRLQIVDARSGGWGHVLGDEGSGYTIGREALQYAARAADGRGPATALLDAILMYWELATPEMILARVYPTDDKTAIAALAPLVLSVARAGDPVARRIETRAARELALAATTVARILEFPPGVLSLAYSGGVLAHETRLRDLVTHRIARAWSVAPLVVEEPASSAARALAERSAQ